MKVEENPSQYMNKSTFFPLAFFFDGWIRNSVSLFTPLGIGFIEVEFSTVSCKYFIWLSLSSVVLVKCADIPPYSSLRSWCHLVMSFYLVLVALRSASSTASIIIQTFVVFCTGYTIYQYVFIWGLVFTFSHCRNFFSFGIKTVSIHKPSAFVLW